MARRASIAHWPALLGLALFPLLAAGSGRDDAAQAALALAEAHYPGQLELYDTHLQKGHYDVVLAVRGDPVTRIRFGIDADPARCRTGTPCEQRLHRAYAGGMEAGAKLKALGAALQSCGVPALGVDDTRGYMPNFRTVVELPLDPARPGPGLDRFTPCIAAFRAALPQGATDLQRALTLRIVPADAAPSSPGSLTFETPVPPKRRDERSYLAGLRAEDTALTHASLRLDPHHVSTSGLNLRLAEAARQALARDPQGGHLPTRPVVWDVRLADGRLDAIHAYVLACSTPAPRGSGPCRHDMAVRLRYDMATHTAAETVVLRDVRDARGSIRLPPSGR